MKDRRFKACQHCCERVRLMSSEHPDGRDLVVDKRGNPECVPGLSHKVMPEVGSDPVG